MIQNVATVDDDENNFNDIILESVFESLDTALEFPGHTNGSSRTSGKENYESIKKKFAVKDDEISQLKMKLELADNVNERLKNVQKDLRDLKLALETKDNKIKTLEKLTYNIQKENSTLKIKITQLEGESSNLQLNITEKETLIAEIKKSSKDFEVDKDKAMKKMQEENFSLKETVALKQNLFEAEQQKSSEMVLKVRDLERNLCEERKKTDELQKEKRSLIKEVRKTSELQKKVRKLKARYDNQNKPFSNISKTNNPTRPGNTSVKQGIFLKNFSTLTATSENINTSSNGLSEKEVITDEASFIFSINENLTRPTNTVKHANTEQKIKDY